MSAERAIGARCRRDGAIGAREGWDGDSCAVRCGGVSSGVLLETGRQCWTKTDPT